MIRIPILSAHGAQAFPPVSQALREPNGLLAAGGDLSLERLLEAYRQGIFPWFSAGEPILWWAPDPRMVFATDRVHVPRRLRRWLHGCDWNIRADHAFERVMHACAAPRAQADGTWISAEMTAAYGRLHEHGHAHSIEVYKGHALVGGIYGVAIGRMFFGESMFSRESNASKVGLLALCRVLHDWGYPLLDAQVRSAHLETLGAFELPRSAFCHHLENYCAKPGMTGSWRDSFPRLQASILA